jgi:hypothetical protein
MGFAIFQEFEKKKVPEEGVVLLGGPKSFILR